MQPLDLQGCTVPPLKDLIHILMLGALSPRLWYDFSHILCWFKVHTEANECIFFAVGVVKMNYLIHLCTELKFEIVIKFNFQDLLPLILMGLKSYSIFHPLNPKAPNLQYLLAI